MPPTSIALTTPAATTLPSRALVIRSCRPHVMSSALAAIRAQHPSLRFDALSHAGHRDSLAAAGINDIVEVPGTRFAWTQLPIETLLQLRARSYDLVVVPLMSGPLSHHLNLMLLAVQMGSHRIAIFSPDLGLRECSRWELLRAIAREWRELVLHYLDVPLALMLMAVAICMPRRRVGTATSTRVLHVITSWGVGGAQRQLAEVLQRTPADIRADVFVLSPADGDFSTNHLRGFDVRIEYAKAWPRLTPTILELARKCRRERYDVVHTWLFLANALGVAAARLAKTPRVISSVRNLSLWKRTWANQWWFRLADTLASQASDVVTVNGTSLVRDHARWARMREARIAVVPNGFDVAHLDIDRRTAAADLRRTLGLGRDVRIVGTVGRLAPEKDHATLIDAWLTAKPANAQLVIVGDGPLRASLIARAGHNPTITFAGESDRARDIIAGLDLFVLPSVIEGFPNVLLEAAMIGVPVLATDVGAARDVVVDDEDLIAPGDAGALATSLLWHLATLDRMRARACRRQAFTRSTFTIDRTVERWLSLYDGAHR